MTGARIRLVVAAALFLGWIGWLGYAVSQKGRSPVLSRAQLTAATHLVVADVAADAEGLPAPAVKVVEVLKGDGPAKGGTIEVMRLASAMPPGAAGFPGPGQYLLPLVGDGKTYRVAGLPRSPGYEATTPERPQIYVWDDETRAQLHGLGLMP